MFRTTWTIWREYFCVKVNGGGFITGRLGKYDEINRNGSIYIDEFGKNPIYYHGPHMKSAELDEGKVFDDIEIGYSNIAPKAFRNVESKE